MLPRSGHPNHLVGWKKVALKPGEIQRVTLVVEPRTLARFDAAAHRWRLGGSYAVSVGGDFLNLVLDGRSDVDSRTIAP